MMEQTVEPGWEVFARIRVELMAAGEEEQLIAMANDMANYTDQESEFDRLI